MHDKRKLMTCDTPKQILRNETICLLQVLTLVESIIGSNTLQLSRRNSRKLKIPMLHFNADYSSTRFAGFVDVLNLLQVYQGLSKKTTFTLQCRAHGCKMTL